MKYKENENYTFDEATELQVVMDEIKDEFKKNDLSYEAHVGYDQFEKNFYFWVTRI